MKTQLLQGDCIEETERLPNGWADLVLTDPPYSSGGLYPGDRKKSTKDKYTNSKFNGASRFPNFSGDNMDQRSFAEFMRMVLAKAKRKSKEGAVLAVFIDWRNIGAMIDAVQMAGWIYRGIVVWDKGVARNTPGRFRQDCEFIVWGTNGQKPVDWTPGFKALRGLYSEKIVSSKEKRHQTEKPVPLMESLMEICPEKGNVFDPFMGSGSTGVACVNTGRNFIGIELSEEIFHVAEERVKDAVGLRKKEGCRSEQV